LSPFLKTLFQMASNAIVSCQVVSMAGMSLCTLHVTRNSTVHDLKDAIASTAFLPRNGWHLMLGTQRLSDPTCTPLTFAGAIMTFNVVHIDANIGHARRAAEYLLDSNSKVRREALGELAILGDAATVAAPLLVGLLQDEDLTVCALAAQILGGLVPVAKTLSLPALGRLLEKTNDDISAELVYDDFMDLPECESDGNWSPMLKVRDAAMDAMKQLSRAERLCFEHH